ncbi:MAG: carboxypeptidase-like regulatory domain-containing protein [Candidatus Sericytochromatia bacterium]|nr:carboxypeptidase-like regulatory domain-containing protein [Candidatus Sericytochromatia bacterium]
MLPLPRLTRLLVALAMLAGCAAIGTNAPQKVSTQLGSVLGLPTFTPGPTVPPQAGRAPVLVGTLVDASGKAVAGATIKAFEALVGNNAGSLVGNNAGARRIATAQGQSDAQGSFTLTLSATGTFNVEGDRQGSLKVFVPDVKVTSPDTTSLGSRVMTPPGFLSGTVRDSKGTPNLTGAQVFIPGSPYSSMVAENGNFSLGAVAAGTYDLRALHPTLGDARLDRKVTITSGQTTQAPELVLATDALAVDRLREATTGATTSVSAPGSTLILEGSGFGHTRGRSFTLEIGSVLVTQATRSSDTRIVATVPSGAQSGDLVLKVDAVIAKAVPLRIMKTLAWRRATWRLGVGDTLDPWQLAEVRDTAGQWIDLAATGAGPLALDLQPDTFVSTAGSPAAPTLEAQAQGSVTLSMRAGQLAAANLALTVGTAGTGDRIELLPPRQGQTPPPTELIRDGEIQLSPEIGELSLKNPLSQWAIYELAEAPGIVPTPHPDAASFYGVWPRGAIMARQGERVTVLGSRKALLVPPRQELFLRVNTLPLEGQPMPPRNLRWSLVSAFALEDTPIATASERALVVPASSSGVTLPLPDLYKRKVVRLRAAGDWGYHGGDRRGPDGQGGTGICLTPCDGVIPEGALVRVEPGARLDDDFGSAPTSFVGSDATLLVESGEKLILRMQDWIFHDNRGSVTVWWDVLWTEP